jgi:cyanophycinase
MHLRSPVRILATCLIGAATLTAAPAPRVQRILTGSPADVTPASVTGGLALIGGGTDLEEAFRWMIARAGAGDIVVLRARGDDAYNAFIAGLGHVDSVETIVVPDVESANDPGVVAAIDRAEAVFIAGGDQANYVGQWTGTGLQAALNRVVARKATLGGTSAGLAVLGEFAFSAMHDTITSREALANPGDPRLTLARGFLAVPALRGLITDTHFVERDRMGRLLAFLSRIQSDFQVGVVHAVAVDRETAVLVDHDGDSVVVGKGPAFFLTTRQTRPVEAPLTTGPIDVYRVTRGGTFDLRAWSGTGGTAYVVSAEHGALRSTQPGGSAY